MQLKCIATVFQLALIPNLALSRRSGFEDISTMKNLENSLLDALEIYVEKELLRVEKFQSEITSWNKIQKKYIDIKKSNPYKTDTNLLDPISQYKLIARYYYDSDYSAHENANQFSNINLESKLNFQKREGNRNSLYFKDVLLNAKSNIHWPTMNELKTAGLSFIQMQEALRLDRVDGVADGWAVDGTQVVRVFNEKDEMIERNRSGTGKSNTNTTGLTYKDCFDIGKVAFLENDYYHTIVWMQEAKNRLRKSYVQTDSRKNKIASQIYNHIAYSYATLEKWDLAFKYAGSAMEHVSADSPDYKKFMGNYRQYKSKLQELKKHKGDSGDKFVQKKVFGDQAKLVTKKQATNDRKSVSMEWMNGEPFSLFDVVDREIF